MAASIYKTKQREIILDYLKNHQDKHVTIEDINNYLKEQNEKVGQTTIYRYINMLVEDGLVRKYIVDLGQPACFQYVPNMQGCERHYHLKCNKCGGVLHMDCEIFKDVEKHLKEKHKFEMDSSKVLLYGICNNCK